MHSEPSDTAATVVDGDVLDRLLAEVPGMMDRSELELLSVLASRSHDMVVELGAFAGLSTTALGLGAQAGPARVEVVTVDAFASGIEEFSRTMQTVFAHSSDPTARRRWTARGSPEAALRHNLARFGVNARIVKGISWEMSDQVNSPIGLLFVDADHTRAGVEKDLAAWAHKVAADGVVAFDDYVHDLWCDVHVVADEWAAREGWTKAESAGKVQVFRRVPRPSSAVGGHGASAVADGGRAAPTATASLPVVPVGDIAAWVWGYLRAFDERDVARCLAFFTDDAVIHFISGRREGPREIEQWHKERFAAGLRLARVRVRKLPGDTVRIEAQVTSDRLKAWKIGKLPIQATLRLERGRIKEVSPRLGPW